MIHQNLAKSGWYKLSLIEQMANIGSEVSRTVNWKGKSKSDATISYKRAMELISLTLNDSKNKGRLKEIARVKELFSDWFLGINQYKSTKKQWQDYFLQFAYAARIDK
jgi:hypothetical protein